MYTVARGAGCSQGGPGVAPGGWVNRAPTGSSGSSRETRISWGALGHMENLVGDSEGPKGRPYIHVYIYIYIYICICVCISIYIYIYI